MRSYDNKYHVKFYIATRLNTMKKTFFWLKTQTFNFKRDRTMRFLGKKNADVCCIGTIIGPLDLFRYHFTNLSHLMQTLLSIHNKHLLDICAKHNFNYVGGL